jgi:site-specific DNA-methyltransferase (adenine-specific)
MTPYYEESGITIYHGDCREVLPNLAVVDLVLTDPPYGMTSNAWDIMPSMDSWWALIRRICVGPVIFTASQPFTSIAVMSNLKEYRHEWIWVKNRGSNFANTVREPFKEHESVLVFAKTQWNYYPQREPRRGTGLARSRYLVDPTTHSSNYREMSGRPQRYITEDRGPSSTLYFTTEVGFHPTQKPLGLYAYLISTYSTEQHLILDCYMGSGTTLLAAKELGRCAIGIDTDEQSCEIAVNRLRQGVLDFAVAP